MYVRMCAGKIEEFHLKSSLKHVGGKQVCLCWFSFEMGHISTFLIPFLRFFFCYILTNNCLFDLNPIRFNLFFRIK